MQASVEIITVGTELLLGDTVDTNSSRIGRALTQIGVEVSRRATVGDSMDAIGDAVRSALEGTGAVIITGGLGPTNDDMTRDAVARQLGVELNFDSKIWRELVERWERVGHKISDTNRSQAMVPEGGTVLVNSRGSAPGLWIESDSGLVILLPGVPREVDGLLQDEVLPRLRERHGDARISSRVLRTAGVSESTLGELLGPLEAGLGGVTLAYLPEQAAVDLRLTAWRVGTEEAESLLNAAERTVRAVAGKWIYASGETGLAEVVLAAARNRGLTIATAESCTGGMIATRLTAVPGCSDVFLGGAVVYANEEKERQLGVASRLIEEYGAVSESVVRAMVEGSITRFGADVAVAVTGVAGPGGGTEAKPVGTVWVAWSVAGVTDATCLSLVGDRSQVRIRASQAALVGLLRRLTSD